MSDVPSFVPAAALVPAYVRAGERVVWTGRPTYAVLARHVLGLLFLVVFGLSFSGFAIVRAGPAGFLVIPAILLVVAILVVLNVLRIRRTEFVLTDQGVYVRTGIVGHSVVQTTFDKITDISLKQDVLGRILGFSDLHVNTAGSNTAPVRMEGLPDALGVKGLVEQAREEFLRRGDDRTSIPAPSAPSRLPQFIPDRFLMTVQCTETGKPFRRPAAEQGRRVPCPHCGKKHIAEVRKPGRARPS